MSTFVTARAAALHLFALAFVAGCVSPLPDAPYSFPETGARLAATIYLTSDGPDRDDAVARFPAVAGGETRVALASVDLLPISARVSCSGEAQLRAADDTGLGLYMRPGAQIQVRVPPRWAHRLPQLVLPPDTARCQIDWGDGHSLPLLRDGEPAPVPTSAPACTPPEVSRADPLARAFFVERALSQTCARPTGQFALFPNELDALQFRLERLTGASVDRTELASGNPDLPLDFSNAPHFDEIVVSYLQVRADLSGYLVARALAFHAARGAKVRIAVSDTLTLPLDRQLFQRLAAQYPNVQIQYFRYLPRGFAPFARLAGAFSKSHHIKIFAGLSQEPGASFALVGGRNLHDGFFFPDLETPPKRPFLHDYTEAAINPVAYVNYYEDFEIGLFDRAIVDDVVAQFDRFWTRDQRGSVMAEPEAPVAAQAAGNDGFVRHFLSLPWADNFAQERLFVDMIDAAEHEILVMSPFLYPTAAIDAALQRAAKRGVRVTLVSRFIGDEPVSVATNALNAVYADSRRDAFAFYAYAPGAKLTHTKLIVIDDRLAIVTSTNLNRRSFFGDTENGFVFLDRAVARALRSEIDAAIADAEPFPEGVGLQWLAKIINALPSLANQF
jgi:phosphatidylserine/phosphatidylglycerophosphate/cardiolipin synthase-like enzyme